MKSPFRAMLATLLVAAAATACGKRIEIYGKVKNITVPKGPNCQDESERLTWRWNQPNPTFSKAVDLLFVTDTSLSLMPERRKLAKAIPRFLKGLPEGADPHIGVMLGHGGKGKWSGSLFAHGSDPKVLVPSELGEDRTGSILEDALGCPTGELAATNGEALLLSLKKSLSGERFARMKSEGFYRDGASLSLVFVSDENDVCYDPTEHGFKGWPDFKDSFLGIENRARKKYCSGVTPELVKAEIESALPGRKISVGAIVHTDPAYVWKWGEDAIGHGFLEFASQYPDSIAVDIKGGDMDSSLSRLASVSTSQLTLMTSFKLNSGQKIDGRSVLVRVDGNLVEGVFDDATQTVQIDGSDAGFALSQVDISACPVFDNE